MDMRIIEIDATLLAQVAVQVLNVALLIIISRAIYKVVKKYLREDK